MAYYTRLSCLGNQKELIDYESCWLVLVLWESRTEGMSISAGIPTITCSRFNIMPASKVPAPKDINPYTARNIIPVILQSFVAEFVIFSNTFRTMTAIDRKQIVATNEAIVNNCGG